MRTCMGLALSALFAVSGLAGAESCSGGASGGMDSTGNDCNDPVAVSIQAVPALDRVEQRAVLASSATRASVRVAPARPSSRPAHKRGSGVVEPSLHASAP